METSPFDAAEKLLEIELRPGAPSLRDLGASARAELAAAGGFSILRSDEVRGVEAHVLSESSLFVRDDALHLLTCGRTSLGPAFEALLRHVRAEDVAGVRLSRQRDRFPEAAASTFDEDARAIEALLGGERGCSSSGVETLSTLQVGALALALDFRVFCEGLSAESRALFVEAPAKAEAELSRFSLSGARELRQLHLFSPAGASLNLVAGGEIACVHVSPEETADAASVESSSPCPRARLALLESAEHTFRPRQISVTLDGRNLTCADEARRILTGQLDRGANARVM